MENNELKNKLSRTPIILSLALGIISVFLLFPQVRDLIIRCGEFLAGRPLTREVWHERFMNFGCNFLAIAAILFSVFVLRTKKFPKIKSAFDFLIAHSFLLFTIVFIVICFFSFWENILHNDSILMKIDSIGQYYPSFLYTGYWLQKIVQNFSHGLFSIPLYDLSVGLGEDVLGCLNYYGLGNPLNILSIFVSRQNQNWNLFLFSATYFLRLWLSGISFLFYCKYMKLNLPLSAFASCLYIFSGFGACSTIWYPEWTSILVYLPIMLLGAEKILKKESSLLLTIAVALGAMSGFYFLYMASVFLAVYVLVRLCMNIPDNSSLSVVSRSKEILFPCLHCLFYYIFGILIAAPILFTQIDSFLTSERTAGIHFFEIIRSFFPDNLHSIILSKFLVSSPDKTSLDEIHLASVVESVCALLLFLLPKTKRNKTLALSVILSVIFLQIPFTGFLFNALREKNLRYIVFVHFAFAVLTVCVLDSLSGINLKFKSEERVFSRKSLLAFLCLLIVLTTIDFSKKVRPDCIPAQDLQKYVDSPVRGSKVISSDTEIFRIECDSFCSLSGRPENVAMLHGYNGLSYWFSMVNGYTQNFMDSCAGERLFWRSFGVNKDEKNQSLCAVKYILSKEYFNRADFSKVEQVDFYGETWFVYKKTDFSGFSRFDRTPLQTSYDKDASSFKITINDSVLGKTRENDEIFISIPYHKNWKAFFNGKEIPIKRSDIAFMSVHLPEVSSSNEIFLRYVPKSFYIGCILSLIALLFIIFQKIIFKTILTSGTLYIKAL